MTPARDPGRQPERTRLAWRRTVLTLTVVGLLAVRLALGSPAVVAAPAVIGVVAAWLAILELSRRRIRALGTPRPDPARWAVPLATLAVAVTATLGVVLITVGSPPE